MAGVPGFASGSGATGAGLPRFPVGAGDERMMEMIRASVALPTWGNYGKAWDEWVALVGDRSVDSSDDERLQVTMEYFMSLRSAGFTAAFAQRRLSGLAFHFKLRGWADSTKHFVFRQALRGWKKERVSKDTRRPVSYSLLVRLLDSTRGLCASPYEGALFRACFSLAFFGALRVGELVPPSRTREGGLKGDDVILANGSLRIRKSKTDGFGRGEWLPLHSVVGPACPVRAVSEYLQLRPPGGSFLNHLDGSPVTRFQFQSVFKRCLVAVGVPPGEFGTHSFRIGAATEAARAGLSNAEVQRIGRWRSSCFAGYIRPELLD